MIPMHIAVDGPAGQARTVNVEILDLPSLTPQAMAGGALRLAAGRPTKAPRATSYHLTGSIDLEGYPPSPLDLWASAGEAMPAPMEAAAAGRRAVYAALRERRPARRGARRSISTSRPFRGAWRWNWRRRGWFQAIWFTPATRWWWRQRCAPGSSRRAMCAFPVTAARQAGRGQFAAAGLGCRYAGPRTEPAARFPPPARSGFRAGPGPASAPGRPHLREPAGPRRRPEWPGKRLPACRFRWPMRWSRCAPRRMPA